MTMPDGYYDAELVPIGDIRPPDKIKYWAGAYAKRNAIRATGLLMPITVDADNKILDGEYNFFACEMLGFSHVPVRRVAGS